MAWTNANPVSIGNATKKADYDAAFDNSQFLRDSVGDFTNIPIGTGLTGSAAAPIITWRDDTDTGIYRIGGNNIGITCFGAKVLDISATGLGVTGGVTASTIIGSGDGAVGAPAFYFTGDTNTGIYRIGADNIGITCNGAKVLDIGTTGLGVTGVIKNGDGAVGAASYSFSSDTNTGIYRIGADNIGVACNGAKVLDVATTGLGVTGSITASTIIGSGDGAVGTPAFYFTGDTNTGIYRIGADNIGVACNGAKVLDVTTTGLAITGDMTTTDNVGVGSTVWGTSAAKVLAIGNGTPPSTSIANGIQIYSADSGKSAASLALFLEDVGGTAGALPPVNWKPFSLRINGTEYVLWVDATTVYSTT